MKISKSTLSLLAALVFGGITCVLVFANKTIEKSATNEQSATVSDSKNKVIEIKEKMFISQVNDVYLNPDEYMGKTIKVEGLFKCEKNLDTDQQYNYVMRYGPGCCGSDGNVGFEIAYSPDAGETGKPDITYSFPPEDTWIEAVGVVDSYLEDGYPYVYLKLNSLKEKSKHGSEFVNQ